MQKKLIALAIAGLSSAAFAQSNVTIYGVADATYDFVSVSGGATPGNNVSYNRVSTNSSVLGFKGAETLGNGLTAVFQYESGVSFDAQGALGATRDSFVGLAGGFGTVAIGNLTGPTRAFGAAVDVNDGATGTGSNSALIGKLGNVLTGTLNTATVSGAATGQVTGGPAGTRSATQASAFDTRFQNAIAYISPTMGGFTFIAGYVANEGKSDVVATQSNPSAWDIGLKYANGPILVALATSKVSLKNATDTTAKNTRLVASYDFGVGTVRALWDSTKADTNTIGNAKQNVWGLGATIKAGAGNVLFQHYAAKDATGSGAVLGLTGNATGNATGAKLTEIGYEYGLSKRTLVKATYATLKNDTNAIYDFGVNSTGLAFGNAGAKVNALQVGLRHKF